MGYALARAFCGAVVTAGAIVGAQLAYRWVPRYFAVLMLAGFVILLFYRKLDRIEAALSEERRQAEFRRRQAGGKAILLFAVIALVLSAAGSFAVWRWLDPPP